MTITATQVRTVTGLGNGINTDHTIGFPFQLNSTIEVYVQQESVSPYTLTQLVFGAGAGKYTISGGDPGLTVVMGTAMSVTQRAIILRATPRKQTVDYVGTAAFPADDHEEQMDRQVMMDQEDNDKMSRTVQLWPTDTAFDPTLPSDLLADGLILVNSTRTGFVAGPVITDASVAGPPGADGADGADGLNAPTLQLRAPAAGVRDGVNQTFTLTDAAFVGADLIAVTDGTMFEVVPFVGVTATISVALAAHLSNPAIDLKFLYIKI